MERLIQADGQPHYGIFAAAPGLINYRDFAFRSPMGRRLGALAKWRRFHQFQYFGLISDQLIGGCALANLSLLGMGFVYLFHPPSGRMIERQFKLPLSLGTRFSQRPDDGLCELRSGRNLLRLENRAEPKEKRLLVELDDGMRIDACFSETAPAFQPMCINTPTAVNGWVYAQKVAGVRCSGQVKSSLGDFDLGAIDAFAHHDWSAGYMRPETHWNWACLSGMAAGQRVGLNLSCGVNETSFTENCYWLDGELLKVDTVRFAFDREQPLQPWHISSHDGQVALRFEARGLHQERLNLGVLASNFKQVFGQFSGVLRPPGRAAVVIERQWGFVEDQYVKW
ncbi:DUF2804 domain-containing protein [Pseudomonas lalucatii]|uniref:DUF2804 domain-containing protein n=1 Tax=Pseudomonas lalucatii TaxID=1424203 RepID=A0ABS5PWW1_9PSED|nr:DUF2804 domain-containing protein [Pseudomonas lalucatii]MBS7660990.1 DUF2804 domain-containing protein [Pseudomonas lalucatii]MBS7724347.1 DUF2804 domain-containing protein [Pseudomonas lalucatii]